jgi:hypothetical protein
MENINTTSSTTTKIEKKLFQPRLLLQALAFTGILYFSVGQAPRNSTRSLFQSLETSTPLSASVSNSVLQHASVQLGVPTSALRVVRAQPKTWSDDCLELNDPEVFCTQILVPGWQVAVASNQQSWIYRTNASGSVIKLESSSSSPSKKSKEVA